MVAAGQADLGCYPSDKEHNEDDAVEVNGQAHMTSFWLSSRASILWFGSNGGKSFIAGTSFSFVVVAPGTVAFGKQAK